MVQPSTHGLPGAATQIALAAACMATATLLPPAEGSLLAVPLGRGGTAATVNIALAHGARIEGRGPFPGSIVLRGERDRLAGPLRTQGIVLLAGSSWMCRS